MRGALGLPSLQRKIERSCARWRLNFKPKLLASRPLRYVRGTATLCRENATARLRYIALGRYWIKEMHLYCMRVCRPCWRKNRHSVETGRSATHCRKNVFTDSPKIFESPVSNQVACASHVWPMLGRCGSTVGSLQPCNTQLRQHIYR